MIRVLLHHEVADHQSWSAAFDSAIDVRHAGGDARPPPPHGRRAERPRAQG